MQHHTLPLFAAGIVVAAVCSAAMLGLVGAWCWKQRRRERGVGAAADGLQVQEGEHNTDGLQTVLIGRGGSSFESGLGADSSQRIDAEQQGVQVGLSWEAALHCKWRQRPAPAGKARAPIAAWPCLRRSPHYHHTHLSHTCTRIRAPTLRPHAHKQPSTPTMQGVHTPDLEAPSTSTAHTSDMGLLAKELGGVEGAILPREAVQLCRDAQGNLKTLGEGAW